MAAYVRGVMEEARRPWHVGAKPAPTLRCRQGGNAPILNAENFLNAQTIALRTPLNYPLQNSHRALLTRLWVQILLGLAFVLSSLQSLLHRESCPNYLCF